MKIYDNNSKKPREEILKYSVTRIAYQMENSMISHKGKDELKIYSINLQATTKIHNKELHSGNVKRKKYKTNKTNTKEQKDCSFKYNYINNHVKYKQYKHPNRKTEIVTQIFKKNFKKQELIL